ncbi:MAG: hypothetical protein ACR5LG_07955 [Sodalis sp. (in: enterobacteria)]|uniref:hypothetical protein n=1 Tax=Sodalis sp. (in: enterobacteria) TaxID=1898979 RepID=UPI003F3B20C8
MDVRDRRHALDGGHLGGDAGDVASTPAPRVSVRSASALCTLLAEQRPARCSPAWLWLRLQRRFLHRRPPAILHQVLLHMDVHQGNVLQ